MWPLLRASLSPHAQKAHALRNLAWPRALHGVSVVPHFKVLRTGAMRGLRADRKGANQVLHLSRLTVLAGRSSRPLEMAVSLGATGRHGLIQDRLGSFSLFASSWDELCVRFRLAWARVLHDAAGHRPTFEGLEEVGAVATQK